MPDSDNNSPWDPPPKAERMATPGSVFEVVPPPGEPPPASSAIPPMPTIPPPAAVEAALTPDTTVLVPPPIPTTEPPSVAEPLLSGDYDARPQMPEPPGGGGRVAWLGAIIGAFVMLLGGGYFALTALNASGGAATPDEAVQKLIDAVNNEDVIGLGEMLEPGERRTLVTPVVKDILPELERLGILSGEFDPSGVDGVDIEITDFTYRIEEVAGSPDLVHVYATGGTSTFSTDVDAFPFGDEIRTRFGDRMQDESQTTSAVEDGDPLTLVERDGRWYVSIWFSVAEVARIEAGETLPAVAEQPQPLGSDSPEAAVENLVLEASDFDLDGMLRRLDPDETDALYRYSPLFMDDAQSAAQELRQEIRDEGVDWSVSDMDFAVDRSGDDAIVEVTDFTFALSGDGYVGNLTYGPQRISGLLEGEIDGERGRASLEMTPTDWAVRIDADGDELEADVHIDPDARTVELTAEYNGESFTGSIEFDDAGVCSGYSWATPDGVESGCLEDETSEWLVDAYRGQLRQVFDIAESGFPGSQVAVHETDGQWYVSPTLSTMHWLADNLRGIDEQEFQEFLDRLDEETEDSTISAEEMVGGVLFSSLPGTSTPFVPFYLYAGTGFGFSDFIYEDPAEWIDLGSESTVTFSDGESVAEGSPFEEIEVSPPDRSTVTFLVEPGAEPTPYLDGLEESGERHVYLVDLDEGQELGVTLFGSDRVGNSGLGDPLVTIETPSGEFWLQNDDFDGLNSGIQFVAPDEGQWRVVVEDLNGQAGDYELTLERPNRGASATIGVEPAIDTAFVEADIEDFSEIVVEPGSPFVVPGELSSGFFDVYAFEVDAGTTLTITLQALESGALDPRLIVRDGDLEVIADNDDAGFDSGLEPLDSKVELTARRSDVFYVEARSVIDLGEGLYTLTIVAS